MRFFILPVLVTCVCATTHPSPVVDDPEALPTDRRERTGSDFELVSTEEAPEIGHANLLRVKEKEPVSSWTSGFGWFGFRNLGQAESLDSGNAKNLHPREHAADEDELQAEPEIVDNAHHTDSDLRPSVAPGKIDDDQDPSNVDHDIVIENNSTSIPSEAPLTLSIADNFPLGDESELSNEVGFRKNLRDVRAEDGAVERWIWATAILLVSGAVGMYLNK